MWHIFYISTKSTRDHDKILLVDLHWYDGGLIFQTGFAWLRIVKEDLKRKFLAIFDFLIPWCAKE